MDQPKSFPKIDRNPGAVPPEVSMSFTPPNSSGKTGKFAQAAVDQQAVAEQLKKRRAQIHKQAKMEIGGVGVDAPQEDPVAAPVREDIESIEITLRDGRVVEYGPPTNISLADRIARLYSGRSFAEGGPDPGISEYRLTRLLMGVRAVDGRPVVSIANLIDRTRLANLLGDEALDILHHYDTRHWPPLTEAELPMVKKNLRQR